MSEPLLAQLQNVSKTYAHGQAEVRAVKQATCSVAAGDRIAIVGPSGSGKSTMLHMMGGVDSPSDGEIDWPALGKRQELRPRLVSYVFQTGSLLDALTAKENVELPLIFLGVDAAEADRRAEQALEMFELDYIAHKLPEELSGGQSQRVALARAVVGRPRLILADEPTGQLDHPTADRLIDLLFVMLDGSATALVVATHDQLVADRMDKTWRMHYGALEAEL